jgi:hypothetical protein
MQCLRCLLFRDSLACLAGGLCVLAASQHCDDHAGHACPEFFDQRARPATPTPSRLKAAFGAAFLGPRQDFSDIDEANPMFQFSLVRHAHDHSLRCRASATVACMFFLISTTLQAQPTMPMPRPDPLDPKASVPAVRYEVSLTASKPMPEEPPSWRQANDTVTRIGGWRAYAREAQQNDAPAATAPTSIISPPSLQHKERGKPMHHGHGAHKTP